MQSVFLARLLSWKLRYVVSPLLDNVAIPLCHKLFMGLNFLFMSLSHALDQHSITRRKNFISHATTHSLVAKPQICGEPCNTVCTNFLLFLYLRGVLFKNLNDATLSFLGIPPIYKLRPPLRKSFFRQYLSLCMISK